MPTSQVKEEKGRHVHQIPPSSMVLFLEGKFDDRCGAEEEGSEITKDKLRPWVMGEALAIYTQGIVGLGRQLME